MFTQLQEVGLQYIFHVWFVWVWIVIRWLEMVPVKSWTNCRQAWCSGLAHPLVLLLYQLLVLGRMINVARDEGRGVSWNQVRLPKGNMLCTIASNVPGILAGK